VAAGVLEIDRFAVALRPDGYPRPLHVVLCVRAVPVRDLRVLDPLERFLKLIGLHGEVYSEEEAEEFKAEIAAQEKAEKKVDTSVWNGVPKKEVNDARNNLDSLYATWTAKGGNSAAGKKAKKEADDINKWAEKHELVIVIDKYLNLFDNPKVTKLLK
jgi:hypothetical protein